MRIAFVSPYSWNIPGGVNRHIEELAATLEAQGHEPTVLAPWDPDDRLTRFFHRGAVRQREVPARFVSLGRTVGLPMNGAHSNISVFPTAAVNLRARIKSDYDVVHIHEPVAPVACWDAVALSRLPSVATFHAYSTNSIGNNIASILGARRIFNKLHGRIAVSEAAKWTGERFFGGEYRVIPNGVDLSRAPQGPKTEADHLRVLFVGRSEERKGLPVLLRAFSALREYVPARLAIIGAAAEEVEPLLMHTDCDSADVDLRGRVSSDELWDELLSADVLCAPSLGGESFGMVLVEAQAAGTPVVCSDIAGYRDVARDGQDAILVPAGKPADLALALESLWLSPERRLAMGRAGRENARRYDWPHVADRVTRCYEDAVEVHARAQRAAGLTKFAQAAGLLPAGGQPRKPARRLPSLEPAPRLGRAVAWARRVGVGAAALAGGALALLAVRAIGIDSVVSAFVRSSPSWVLVAVVLMVLAPLLRALSWHAILRAAMPNRIVRRRDVLRGTLIGIIMSATLPARLGEPSRALVVARRIGRARDSLPVVAGSLISQTLLNVLALTLLGATMLVSVPLFRGGAESLLLVSIAPAVLLVSVLVAPLILRGGTRSRSERLSRLVAGVRGALVRVRSGLRVFGKPKLAALATTSQLAAWVLQWLSCLVLFYALGLEREVGLGAAAAVLFAVNVTAVVPATPSNLGVFQAAVIAVLKGAYGVDWGTALAYGVILQAVEIGTAVAMGIPALMGEGLSWRDVRGRALAAAPVELPGRRERVEPLPEVNT